MRRLIGLIIVSLILAGCAKEQAQADIMLLNAKRDDNARAIQQQYDQAKADIQAKALAELDLAKHQAQQQIETDRAIAAVEYQKQTDLNRLAAEFKQQMDELEAKHQAALADIQARIDRTRAEAARDVILALAIGIGGAVLFILVGRGIGNGLTALARNRGEIVRPDPQTGQFPAIVRADAVFLPSRMTGAYMMIRRPSVLEKIIIALGTAIALARGKHVEQPQDPWIQVPPSDEAQQQVTARDQAHGLLTSATRNGQHSEVADKAVQQVFHTAEHTEMPLESRLPTEQRVLTPAELDRITEQLDDQP